LAVAAVDGRGCSTTGVADGSSQSSEQADAPPVRKMVVVHVPRHRKETSGIVRDGPLWQCV